MEMTLLLFYTPHPSQPILSNSILEEKNYHIENYLSYLNYFYGKETLEVQYIKNWDNLDVSIKLELTETNINESNNPEYYLDTSLTRTNKIYKYAVLEIPQNSETIGDTINAYYFIKSVKRISKNTAIFNLRLDVLNTFIKYDLNNTSYLYGLSEKTHILREHKDRFEVEGNRIYPKIDKVNEGINPPLYAGSSHEVVQDVDLDFYLIYRNRNNPTTEDLQNPVDCYICASEKLKFAFDEEEGTPINITADALEEGKFYYLTSEILYDNATITLSSGLTYPINTGSVQLGMFYKNSEGTIIFVSIQDGAYITHETSYVRFSSNITTAYAGVSIYSTIRLASQMNALETETLRMSDYRTSNSIYDVDRTDAKIIKIIKLPYSPIELTYRTGTDIIIIDKNIRDYDGLFLMFKLKDGSTKFDYKFTDSVNIYDPLISKTRPSPTQQNRTDTYEFKLYNSEFYLIKYYYDSFNCSINLEDIQRQNLSPTTNTIEYVVSTTINSRFMFIFERANLYSKSLTDYNGLLVVARNNDITLYNQQYINYIRTGYNYDVKNKQRQETTSRLGTGLSLITGAIGLATMATGNPLASGIAFTTSAISGIMNSINTQTSTENALSQKLSLLKEQATSVSGSDDVDLMSVYSNNRLQLKIYEPSDTMKELLSDLFYYYGYKANYYGKPNVKSRKYFNFLQCEPIFEDVITRVQGKAYGYSISALSVDIREELTRKFKEGITFFHYVNGVRNLAQTFENWETTL